jgi:DNA end-binding protein Ku
MMPHSNWKGYISFGLVNIPITLFNSEDPSQKVSFHQIDKRNKARIKYKRINEETGKEVNWDNIIKGYAYDKETILPVGESELKKVAGENARTIAIENFVKKNNIDFIDVYKTYYLVPDKKGEKGYVILREALEKSQTIGIAKVIISTKEYIAAVACYKNALVLYLLRYNSEIIPLSDLNIPSDNLAKHKATIKEVKAALTLVKSMTEKWNPKKYKDEFQDAVHKWADHKIKHAPEVIMHPRSNLSTAKNDKDLIGLLRKSLARKKGKSAKKYVQINPRKSSRRKHLTVH